MIVVFGSVNFDLIFTVPAIPVAGDTVLASATRFEPGGKGANQAVAAARDGALVAMAGAVGRDAMADAALAGLRDAGADLSRVAIADARTGCAAVVGDPAGHNAIVVGPGANLLARQSQIEDALLTARTTLLLQMETDPEENAALIRRARARGCRVILSLAPALPLPRDALAAVDLLLVNEREAAWLGARLNGGSGAAVLRAALGVAVIRTLGERGVEYSGLEGDFTLPAHTVDPVDTTAAGDCFAGVLASGLDRGLPMRAAASRAVVAAALCCTRPGSQGSLPKAAETDAAETDAAETGAALSASAEGREGDSGQPLRHLP